MELHGSGPYKAYKGLIRPSNSLGVVLGGPGAGHVETARGVPPLLFYFVLVLLAFLLAFKRPSNDAKIAQNSLSESLKIAPIFPLEGI